MPNEVLGKLFLLESKTQIKIDDTMPWFRLELYFRQWEKYEEELQKLRKEELDKLEKK